MTLPVVAPAGTGTEIEFALQEVGVANVPLNCTVLVPCDVPKLLPAIVTEVPTRPDDGVKLLMLGVGKTVKRIPLLAFPLTVTTTLPVVAPLGTGTVIEVVLHEVGDAVVPLNLTVLVPCGDPKPLPVIVTTAPTAPDVGERLVILGTAMAAVGARQNSAAIRIRRT